MTRNFNQNKSLQTKALLILSVAILSFMTAKATLIESQLGKRLQEINEPLETAFETNNKINAFDKEFLISSPKSIVSTSVFSGVTWQEYLEFAGGAVVGGGVTIASNTTNTCISSVFSVVSEIYTIYHYLADYISTGNASDIAYGMTYVIKILNTGFQFDCNADSFSVAPTKINKSLIVEDSVTDMITSLDTLLENASSFLTSLEVSLDT